MAFFFLLILIFILIPIGRVFLAVYKAKRQTQRMWEQYNNNAQAFRRQYQQRSRGYSQPDQPQPKKKKIGRDVGEYVDFEEIAGSSTTQTEQSNTHKEYHEQQVTDAEWEEIS